MSQLAHHNANVRHDSLTGLRELFTLHPIILTLNLSVLLEKISPIFTDSSSAVRQALLLLLKHIIGNVQKCSLVLFFPRLATCIMCAMTHINNAIQLDSLKYLQLFLSDHSGLLIKHAPKLPNFYLNLLTSQSNVIDVTKADSAVFTSKVDSTTKLVPMKTRLEIFTQLSVLLKASIDRITVDRNNDVSHLVEQIVPSFDVVNRKQIFISNHSSEHCTHFFDLSKPVPSVKLIRNWGICPPINAFIKDGPVKKHDDECYLFSCFTMKLLPVLFECWIESGPIHMISGSINFMELDLKMAVIKLLLYTVQLAHVYSGENGMSQLRNLYSSQFQRCFLTYFPFENLYNSEHLFIMNLYLCEVTILLYEGFNKLSEYFAASIQRFFVETLPSQSRLFADHSSILSVSVLCFTRCLRSIILVNNENPALTAMLKGGISFFNNCHMQSQAKKYFIKFFFEVLILKEKMGKIGER